MKSNDAMKRWIRWVGIAGVAFSTTVFICGFFPVSPFAHLPNGLIFLFAIPAVTPFIALVASLPRPSTWRSRKAQPWEVPMDAPRYRFRWRDVLTARRATFLMVLGAVVFFSFFAASGSYEGGADIVDGRYAFTDHGKLIRYVTRQEWLERRTDESRMFTGHFVLFGSIGLLGKFDPKPHSDAEMWSRPERAPRRNKPWRPSL